MKNVHSEEVAKMANDKYISSYNIVDILTNEVKSRRHLLNCSDAFYFVDLKYYLNISEDQIHDAITDLSYVKKQSVFGVDRDNGIDVIYIDRSNKIIYIFNFKYSCNKEKLKNYPSDECDKILSYLDIVFSYDRTKEYYFNEKLKQKTEEIVDFLGEELVTIKIVFASNYYQGLESTKKTVFEENLRGKGSNIQFEEFHLNDFMDKYLIRNHKEYKGICAVDKDMMFPKSLNSEVSLFVVKIKAIDLLKLFINDKIKREQKQPLSPMEIKESAIEEDLFDDNVRIFLSKNNITNKKIIETARQNPREFFFYNNGVTIICDSCKIMGGAPSSIKLLNYQVVNGGQTIHAIYEAAHADYNCLYDIEILCRIFAGTDENKRSKIARYTNTQTPVTERDLSSLDYVQKLLSEEFALLGLYYERKANQYKSKVSRKYRYDSWRAGQLLLAFKLGKPNIARSNKKEVFSDNYVEKIFDGTVSAKEIIQLYKLDAFLKADVGQYRQYCKNAWLYLLYFYRLVFEKYRGEIYKEKIPNTLDSDFDNIKSNSFEDRCKKVTLKLLKMIVEKKKSTYSEEYLYDDSNYFKREQPINDFIDILETYGESLEKLETMPIPNYSPKEGSGESQNLGNEYHE